MGTRFGRNAWLRSFSEQRALPTSKSLGAAATDLEGPAVLQPLACLPSRVEGSGGPVVRAWLVKGQVRDPATEGLPFLPSPGVSEIQITQGEGGDG